MRRWNIRVWHDREILGETVVTTRFQSPVGKTADEAKQLGLERLGLENNERVTRVTALSLNSKPIR